MKQPDSSVIPQVIKDAILTQRHGEALSRAFEYSATVLCKSPRQAQLEIRHRHEFETPEIFNLWYSFAGDAFHEYIEKRLKGNDRYLVEKRIINFDKPIGGTEDQLRRVGAKFDAYDKETKTLYDHKTTTTYIYGKEMKLEWVQQLMINAYFLEKEGFPVEKVSINAIYVDWRDQKYRYSKDDSYPCAPCTSFDMEAWSMKDREYLYKDLLKQHIEAESLTDDDLPYCSGDYCWETPGKVAVYKEGAAKAIRLVDTYEQALDYIKWKGLKGVQIERRKATRKRCEQYCQCAPFCNQYQEWLQSHKETQPCHSTQAVPGTDYSVEEEESENE